MDKYIKIINDHIDYLEKLYAENETKIEKIDAEIRNDMDTIWRTKEMIVCRLFFDNQAIIKEIEKYRGKLNNV